MIWLCVGLIIGLGGGWFLKGKYGAKVTEVKDAVL